MQRADSRGKSVVAGMRGGKASSTSGSKAVALSKGKLTGAAGFGRLPAMAVGLDRKRRDAVKVAALRALAVLPRGRLSPPLRARQSLCELRLAAGDSPAELQRHTGLSVDQLIASLWRVVAR